VPPIPEDELLRISQKHAMARAIERGEEVRGLKTDVSIKL
jgi:hypothetical protein